MRVKRGSSEALRVNRAIKKETHTPTHCRGPSNNKPKRRLGSSSSTGYCHRCNEYSVSATKKGYVTTAVVGILAILSLLATRSMIGASVDNYRASGYSQGLTTALYAAEVALQEAITDMEGDTANLVVTLEGTCVQGFENESIQIGSGDGELQAIGEYRAEALGENSSRYMFRVYATASYSIFTATVSQVVSVDDDGDTVYVIPGTWSDRISRCSN